MSVTTYQAVVEAGQIRLPAGVSLPDKTTVYVVVPPSAPSLTEAERHAQMYADPPDAESDPSSRVLSGGRSLLDLLEPYIGTIDSSEYVPGGAQMSQDTGRRFAEGMQRKRDEGHL